MHLRVVTPYKLISHETANIRKLYFTIACNIYFFQIFQVEIMSVWKFLYIIKTSCEIVYPPKIFFIKLTKSHISSLIVRIFFKLVWVWKILLLYVKKLNGYLVPHFSRVTLPPTNHFGHVKKYMSLSFSSTATYVRTNKIGGGHLPRVPT